MVNTFFKVCFASCQDGRLKKGDQLIAVDNQPIVGLSHAEVSCVKFCLSKLKKCSRINNNIRNKNESP